MILLSPALLLLLLPLVAFLAYHYLRRRKTSKPYPPGPRGWELVPAFFASIDGSLPLHVQRWVQQYGDIIYLPHPQGSMLFMANPNDVKELYGGKSTEKVTNDRMRSYVADTLCRRKNLAFSDPSDPNWTKMRKLMHSSLKFYGEGIAEFEWMVTETLDKLVKELDSSSGQNVPVKEAVEGAISSIIGLLLTGEQEDKHTPVWNAIRMFNASVLQIADPTFSFAIKSIPFLEYIPGTYYYKCSVNITKAKEVVYQQILQDRKKKRSPGLPRGVVDKLLEYQSNEGVDWMTDDHLMGQIMDIVAGGTNTSVNSTSSIILYLLNYPEVMRKAQQEVDRVIGHARKPRLADRNSCHYTEAILLESFRCVSVVPLGFDHAIREDVDFKGYTVPKGTVAFGAAYVFHKSEALWEDPESFRPERFLDDKGEVLPATHPIRQNLMPFSTGKRACPGEGFARARIFLFITTLLQHFDILPPANQELPSLGKEVWDFSIISTLKPFNCRFVGRQL